MHEKLLPFTEVLQAGTVEAVRVAEMAGVELADVEAALLELHPPTSADVRIQDDEVAGAPPDEATDEEPVPEGAADASAVPTTEVASVVAAPVPPPTEPVKAKAPEATPQAPPPAEKPRRKAPPPAPTEDAPATIRATRSFRTTRPDGRTWDIGFRDVYNGVQAEDLWKRHRDAFEPFRR